jgi:hypothetical protein
MTSHEDMTINITSPSRAERGGSMFRFRSAVLVLNVCLAFLTRVTAEEAGSLKATEKVETGIVLSSALTESKALKEKLAAAEVAVSNLQKNLAIKTTEAESFRRKAGELGVRLEALGTGNLDDRLLKLLNDLKIAEDDRRTLRSALIALSESVLRYSKVSVSNDATTRLDLEAAMRDSAKVLGLNEAGSVNASADPSTLTDGMVVSIKEDLNLVVANIGSQHGVKVGMPFEVVRDNAIVGSIRVVDVREKIAGALIQNLSGAERIKIHDRLKVASQH